MSNPPTPTDTIPTQPPSAAPAATPPAAVPVAGSSGSNAGPDVRKTISLQSYNNLIDATLLIEEAEVYEGHISIIVVRIRNLITSFRVTLTNLINERRLMIIVLRRLEAAVNI